MPRAWGSSWGDSWGDTWGTDEGALQIVGAAGIASAEAFGAPGITLAGAQVAQIAVNFGRPTTVRGKLRITGVGGIESEEQFGLVSVSVNENDLALLLLAA